MARNLEKITQGYWNASTAVNHPDKLSSMTTSEALSSLSEAIKLRPSDWRLTALVHDIRYDIIEGNSEWREKRQINGSISILRIRD